MFKIDTDFWNVSERIQFRDLATYGKVPSKESLNQVRNQRKSHKYLSEPHLPDCKNWDLWHPSWHKVFFLMKQPNENLSLLAPF